MVKKNSLFILFLTVGFLFADPPDWEVNPADYQYNGSATSAVYLNDELVGSENDILAGFVGDEVRGVVNGLYFPVTGNYTFNIMLFSNLASGETITFKYYNAASNQVFCLDETIDFESDMIIGNGLNPYAMSDENNDMPLSYSLDKAYPNPFNPVTKLDFGIPHDTEVSISIYNLQGRELISLVNGNMDAGYHSVVWNADAHASGVYFVKMIAGDYINTQKLLLVK